MNDSDGPDVPQDGPPQEGPDQDARDQDARDQDARDHGARDQDARDQDPGAAGVEHLQRAAREMVAAARSFLDAIEKVVDDRDALKEVSATVTGLAATVGETFNEAVRGRPATWADAAWSEPDDGDGPDESDGPSADPDGVSPDDPVDRPVDSTGTAGAETGSDQTDDSDDDTEDWARPLVDPTAPRRASRVRRIAVE